MFNQERLIARLTELFSLLALLLASIGLYGVTAYNIARRTSEIGIRMALGADRGDVVAMVLARRLLANRHRPHHRRAAGGHCRPPDGQQTLWRGRLQSAGACGQRFSLWGSVRFIAGLVPARRAASIEPVQALRIE